MELRKFFEPIIEHKCNHPDFISSDIPYPNRMFGFECLTCGFRHEISLYDIKPILLSITETSSEKDKTLSELFKTGEGRVKLIKSLNSFIHKDNFKHPF